MMLIKSLYFKGGGLYKGGSLEGVVPIQGFTAS